MSEDLKPCLYCGSTATPKIHDIRRPLCTPFRIFECTECQRKSFEDVWQAPRPIEDALRAELASKDAEIKALDELVEALDGSWRGGSEQSVTAIRARLAEVREAVN